MSSRHLPQITLALSLLTAAGCEFGGMRQDPPTRSESRDRDAPEVVAAPAEPPPDDRQAEIAAWAERIVALPPDDLYQRVHESHAAPRDERPVGPPADPEPDVARPSVVVVPDEPDTPPEDEVPAAAVVSHEAPRIVNVSAYAAAAPLRAPVMEDATSANTPARAGALPDELDQLLRRWSSERVEGSFAEQIDRRIAAVLLGDLAAARRPLEMVTLEQARLAGDFIEALIAVRQAHGGEPVSEAERVMQSIERLREALALQSGLRLGRLEVCRRVVGLGLYETIEPPVFTSGRAAEFVAYCEIRNLANAEHAEGGFETVLDVTTALLRPRGEIIHETQSPAIRTRWRDRRQECFIAPLVTVPAGLSPGEYVLKLTVGDRIGGKVGQQRATIRVVAGP